MDRLDAMSLFVATVEAGSLSAAARRAGMPLATVSRKLSELEKHLKTRLLNRSTRRLTLTDAGQSYLAACRRILDEVSEAERTAAGFTSPLTGLSGPALLDSIMSEKYVVTFQNIEAWNDYSPWSPPSSPPIPTSTSD